MKDKVMLIDGNSIVNRAFYGLPLLTNSNGLYTNGVYGFLNIILKMIDDEKPKYIGVAFDIAKKTFRNEKFSEYKGTRKGMPDELREQMPLLKELLELMNISIFELENYEADDILGTLAKKCEQEDLMPIVVSGDRDMLQLASENIKIKIPKTKKGKTEVENYFEKDVIEKLEVTPKEFIEVKGLMGDTSDNIPGVPGIGEKTATKIIKEYKTIENAILNIDDIKPKRAKENLLEFQEQARMSKDLATIVLNAPIDIEIEEMLINDMFNEEAYNKVIELELKTLYKRFEQKDESKESKEKELDINTKIIDNIFDAEIILSDLLNEEKIFYSIKIYDGKLSYISFIKEKDVFIFLVDNLFDEKIILSTLKPLFESDIKKVTHNSKSDYKFAYEKGFEINNIEMDLVLGSYVLNPSKDNYEYESLALNFLDEVYPSIEDILGKGKNKINFLSLPNVEKEKVIGREIYIFKKVYYVIKENLKKYGQEDLVYNIEMPLAKVLAKMEITGIGVLENDLIEYGKDIEKTINILKVEILDLAGEDFNINSPSQLGKILFENIGLKGGKKTKTGYSTSASVLEKLVGEHEIVSKVLEYRTLAKLKSTYVDGLLTVIDKETNRIYSTFNQTITTTGRISSTEPNLQNIPIRLELGRKLRKVFVPKDGFVFLAGDYSQIELRVLAHMSEDEEMIDAFKNGLDIHKLTASEVFRTNFNEVTSYQRSNAKAVNFGIVYGISGYSLSQDLEITKKEADRYIKGYFNKYPKVKIYLDESIENAKENGFGVTMFNRRRNIPELTSSNFNIRGFGERIAMNMPIQGSAADIIKIAMIKVFNALEKEKLESKIILQVHDELILEVKEDELERVRQILDEEMRNAVKISVPLDVSISNGYNWYELK